MSIPEDRIAQSLVASGVITDAQLQRAKHMQADMGGPLTEALMRLGFVTAQDLAQAATAIQQERGRKQSLANYRIDPDALRDIPRSVAERHRVLPIAMSDDRIVVAMADATDVFAIDEVRTRTRRKVEPIEVDEEELLRAIDQFYSVRARDDLPTSGAVVDISRPISETGLLADTSDEIVQLVDQRPVIQIVDTVIKKAVEARASDIHIEPRERNVTVRYRIDGLLQRVYELPKDMQDVVAARVKILSNMDIAEKRLPQDGRFQAVVDDKIIDLRVSSLPTFYGEKVVMRLLDKSSVLVSLSQLGFLPDTLAKFERLVTAPRGMILVTGPTGSGKSTTLYAALQRVRSETKNIVTVEDPIEYQVEGINQTQVHYKIGLDFATQLRSILRQDPDVILVGEVRDLDTAVMAFRASLTGHLVLSTLHTNDAPSAVTRLMDMGVANYLIASSVIGVLAQRLVRQICSRCKDQYVPHPVEIEQMGLTEEQAAKMTFHRGRGCDYCRNTGYHGRIGIFELMLMDNDIRQLIMAGASAVDIRAQALKAGMRTLRDDGLQKISAGMTTAEEIIRAVYTEGDLI
jgi:type IV pilus assembly protein PilB